MINYSLLKHGDLDDYPFQTVVFYDLIDMVTMDTLRREYPKDNFIMNERKMGHDKTYKQCFRHLILPGEDHAYEEENLSEAWKELVYELLSPDYREAIAELTHQSLDNAFLGVDLLRFDPGSGCYIAPHADVPWKICTHLFYFVKEWSEEWGGILSYHDCDKENDVVREVLPSMRMSPVLVRSDRSFHSIQPVNALAPESRKVIDIVFYNQIPPTPKPGRICGGVIPVGELAD